MLSYFDVLMVGLCLKVSDVWSCSWSCKFRLGWWIL